MTDDVHVHREASVPPDDLWMMMLATVRYAMGRRTYVTSWCLEMVDRYKGHLTQHQRDQLRAEVETELRMAGEGSRTLGDACDHKAWCDVVEVLRG